MDNMRIPRRTRTENNKRKLTVNDNNVVSVNDKYYKIVDVAGDGNCLFRCFSVHLHECEDFHLQIREECVNYTVEHWREEAQILANTLVEGEGQDYKDATEYRNHMGSDHTMGTDYELGLFIRIRRIPATYFLQYDENDPNSITPVQVLDNEKCTEKAKRMNILFVGDKRSGHWQILRETKPDEDEQETDEEFNPNSVKASRDRKKSMKPSPTKKSRRDKKESHEKLEIMVMDNDADCAVSSTVNDDDIDEGYCNDSDGISPVHVDVQETVEYMIVDGGNLMESAWGRDSFKFEEEKF